MRVEVLLQEKADELLKSVRGNPSSFPNFEKTFQDEMKRIRAGEELWALPLRERTYYAVYLEQEFDPYLLVGVNPNLNISSLFRTSLISKRMAGQRCFGYFLQQEILPVCRGSGRTSISATVSTAAGLQFFQRLEQARPCGIRKIDLEQMMDRIEETEETWKITLQLDID